jgi:hypothetical protein
MRLTLRTLLAYMDDTLDPVHAREIGQKINESPTATKLMGRVRDSMRRRRLTAPKLTGPGAGLDVNTVAEYLDNTVPPERVPDIEKVCLESDMHLAEVGACHQILTLVLGEPADIEPDTRRRMYGLVESEEMAPASEAAPARGIGPEAPVGSFADTMPDFLRQPPLWKTAVPVGATILILLLLGVVVLQFMGSSSDRAAQAPSVASNVAPSGSPAVGNAAAPDAAADDTLPEEPDAAAPKTSDDEPAETKPQAGDAEPLPNDTAPSEPVPALPEGEPSPAEALTPAPSPPTPEPGAEAEAAPPARREVAQYTSTSGLLINYIAGDDAWSRLPNRALIYGGDVLLVPPLYRARFDLETGGTLEVVGPTRLEMLPPPADAAVAVRLEFGRLVLNDLPVATAVAVELEGKTWQFAIARGGSTLAFEVEKPMPLGFEATLAKPAQDFKVYVPQGQVTWRGGSGEQRVEGPSMLVLLASDESAGPGPVVAPLGDAPAWIRGAELGILEQRASHRLQDELTVPFDKPVTLPLIEATQDRRREIRTLAVDCLGAMARFGPLGEALTNDDAAVRRRGVVWLRRWLGHGRQHAAAVREALMALRPTSGEQIYRLLWGYTERDLQDGGAEELVKFLEHDDLSVREVALYNLEEVTGRTFNYQADAPPAQRDRSVRQWRDLLNEGRLVVRQRGRI